jgi:hypothetical protein
MKSKKKNPFVTTSYSLPQVCKAGDIWKTYKIQEGKNLNPIRDRKYSNHASSVQ